MLMDLTGAQNIDVFEETLRELFAPVERYRAELSQLRRGEMSLESCIYK